MRKFTWRVVVVGAAVVAFSLLPAMGEAQGVLFVQGDKVGIGIDTPTSTLHVVGSTGSTRLSVQEQNGGSAEVAPLVLQNSGSGAIKIRMTSGGTDPWDFQAQSTGFAFSRVGSGGSEIFVGNNGTIRMGPGGTQNLRLDTSGNLLIAGTLTENSSHTVKTGFEAVNSEQVLALVSKMPMSVWTYINDHTSARHIGPMAEDFHAAFGLGTDAKHIAPGDKAGVALAAIQGLTSVIGQRDQEIADLRGRLDTLEQMVLSVSASH